MLISKVFTQAKKLLAVGFVLVLTGLVACASWGILKLTFVHAPLDFLDSYASDHQVKAPLKVIVATESFDVNTDSVGNFAINAKQKYWNGTITKESDVNGTGVTITDVYYQFWTHHIPKLYL